MWIQLVELRNNLTGSSTSSFCDHSIDCSIHLEIIKVSMHHHQQCRLNSQFKGTKKSPLLEKKNKSFFPRYVRTFTYFFLYRISIGTDSHVWGGRFSVLLYFFLISHHGYTLEQPSTTPTTPPPSTLLRFGKRVYYVYDGQTTPQTQYF